MSGALADDAVVGKITVVNGKVTVQADGRILKPGDEIHNNDVIQTAADSSTKLFFTDQSMIDLGPNSSFKVSDYALGNGENRTGTFSLFYGKLRSLITKKVGNQGKVEYRSGGAVMGVRGTEFVVDQKTAAATGTPGIVVVAGVVAVGAVGGGAVVPMKAGEMVAASAGSFTGAGISTASPQQMQTAVQSAKTEDKTFTTSATIQPSDSSGGKGSMATEAVGAIVGAAMEAQANSAESADIERSAPEFMADGSMLLPPINLVPGGAVSLTVSVE